MGSTHPVVPAHAPQAMGMPAAVPSPLTRAVTSVWLRQVAVQAANLTGGTSPLVAADF